MVRRRQRPEMMEGPANVSARNEAIPDLIEEYGGGGNRLRTGGVCLGHFYLAKRQIEVALSGSGLGQANAKHGVARGSAYGFLKHLLGFAVGFHFGEA